VPEYNEYLAQMFESIKTVFELTTRIDEKNKNIEKKQESLEKGIDSSNNNLNLMISKIAVLESKEEDNSKHTNEIEEIKKRQNEIENEMESLKKTKKDNQDNWKLFLNFVIQILIIIVSYYILIEILKLDI
jgi:predicted nuclease with TOPRIM domain